MRTNIWLILIFFTAASFISGCSSHSKSEFPSHLQVNYTGRGLGTMFPCGCRIPLGGLSRRGGVLSQDSPYPRLIVDAGNFVASNTAYDRFTGEYILKACTEMGYNAINIGENESIQTIETLTGWDELAQGLLVSANILDENGQPVTRSYIIEEVGGIKVGITGVAAEARIPPDAIGLPERVDPVDPLKNVMAQFNEQDVDFIVLLTDEVSTDIDAILSQVPEIDLVVQGAEFVHSRQQEVLRAAGDTRLVSIGGQGKYLGRIRLDFDPDGSITGEEASLVELDSFVPTMSSISVLMTEFKTELRERRSEFLGDPANPFQRVQAPELIDVLTGYTGEGFCYKCHLGYNVESTITGHSDSWSDLDSASLNDPECLACHTTGYGIPTGLEDPYRDSHLAAVTCEACHGPGAKHVRDMTAIQKGLDPTSMLEYEDSTGIPFSKEVPEPVCIKCHTEEWSPDFDYDTWVEQVKHEAAKSNPPEPE